MPAADPLCLFASTPDIHEQGFLVTVLTGGPEELAERALALGYDGFEFMPNPTAVPDPGPFVQALEKTGAVLPVVNTGRMAKQGLTLFHEERDQAIAALDAFKRMLDFAGAVGAKVGLGIARGPEIFGLSTSGMQRHAEHVFRDLTAHAEQAGTVILLESAETQVTRFIMTMEEVMEWVDRIDSPAFGAMMDTVQLSESETSIDAGILASRGEAQHLHLFDVDRWPPGTREEGRNWDHIFGLLRDNYNGSASVALAPEGDIDERARQAAQFIRSRLT